MEPKTGKRIVSKGAYAKAQADRAASSIFGVGLWLVAIFFALVAIGISIGFVVFFFMDDSLAAKLSGGIIFLFLVAFFGGVAFLLGTAGKQMINDAANIDPGVPLTRANTADIPAPDSLVRASSEPLQAQEGVLLRAVVGGQETSPEQLVRASAGMNEEGQT